MQTEQPFFDFPNEEKCQWIKLDQLKRPISTLRLFEGTLFVRSRKLGISKPRFFRLFSDRLNIYKNGREQKEIATLFLANVYLDFDCIGEQEKYPIVLRLGVKKFIMGARSQESRQKWNEQLKKTCILNNYRDEFLNLKVIGKGTFAKVLLAQRKLDQKKYAVKTFQKSALMDKTNKQRLGLLNEINLLRSCDHPNIIKLYEIYESGEYIYMVMELLEGGELFDVILNTPSFTEQKVAQIMFKIFDALEYLHTKNIMHRDIKPENILLKDKSDNFDLKIADFGLASYTEADLLIRRCGTPGYVAPEILEDQKYDEKVDVFSAGIILYILLTGQAPFFGSSLDDILDKNRECQINFKDIKVSDEALDLLQKTLDPNPKYRISSLEALSHPFISRLYNRVNISTEEIPLEELPNDNYSAFENMKKFSQIDQRFKISNLKQNNLLIQQTPFLGVREFDPLKASSDSWLMEKPNLDQKIQFCSPNLDKNSSESECSLLNTPQSTKESQRKIQLHALQSLALRSPPHKQLQSPPNQNKPMTQMDKKKANQVRDQLRKFGS